MAYYGVDSQVRIHELTLNFKNIIRNKGGMGLRNLSAVFQRFDSNGNKKLDAYEFEQALSAFG